MSDLAASNPDPAGSDEGDIGYASLWVRDVERAATFFSAVLGWRYGAGSSEMGRQVEGQNQHHGLWGGVEHPTLFCCFAVDDIDAAAARVRAAGGSAANPHEEPYGQIAECVDLEGGRFAVFESLGGARVSRAGQVEMTHGDLAYVAMEFADEVAARTFFATVFDWTFSAGQSADGWNIERVTPMMGLSGGHERPINVPMYCVDDVRAAAARVHSAGGEATEPERQSYGLTSMCVDDQGTRFYLGQF